MDGKIKHFEKDGRPVLIYLPEHAHGLLPVLYMLAGPEPELELTGPAERAEVAVGRGECSPFIAVAIGSPQWNTDYTPWPAPPLFGNEPPFTGGAPGFIHWLTRDLIPYAEEKFPEDTTPRSRSILGYSLAGLTALYTMYAAGDFGACGCCSGSLWYDGWTEFMASHRPRSGSKIYLSLGKNEEKAKNSRMAAVGDATRAAHETLSQSRDVAETALVWHDGGHFADVPYRVAMAMIWLSR